jgi:LEA14-like dessication related protein
MRRYFVLAAMLATTTTGCSVLGGRAFQEPVVRVRDVQLRGLGLTGGSVDVSLAVYNPNGYDLDATRLTYNLKFDTVTFATGVLTDRMKAQSKDTLRVTIPVNFTYRGVGEAGRQIINTGTLNYDVTGDVTVGTPIGNFTVPFSDRGRVSSFGRGQ